ncbi:MAG: GNAT family N-acetyltransferase [Phototrophicales bacterium]
MTSLDDPSLFQLTLNIIMRQATANDLPKLEWYGQYRHYRNLFRRTYEEQLKGRRSMLLADLDGFPVGYIFIQWLANNKRIADGKTRAYLYSFRVMNILQGRGLGTHIMRHTESMMIQQGYSWAIIAVAKENHGALRLYQRLGYHIFADDPGQWSYEDHKGIRRNVNEPCWILEKNLKLGYDI